MSATTTPEFQTQHQSILIQVKDSLKKIIIKKIQLFPNC